VFYRLQENWDTDNFKKYKVCRNTLNRALNQVKRNYYNNYINEKKNKPDEL